MSDKNVKAVQQLYQAFGEGNIQGILDHLTDDIEWHEPPGGAEPWGGTHRGKPAIAEFFKNMAEAADVEAFEPREFIGHGNKVIVLGYYRFKLKPVGPAFETDWVMTWDFKGDKVKRFQVFKDSATEVAALRIAQQALAATY